MHAAIDACLEAMGEAAAGARVAAVRLTVPALSKALADRPHPTDFFAAQISLQHWTAHACLRRSAGIAALRSEAIAAPDIAALRAKVEIVTDATFSRDEATAEIHLDGGSVRRAHVANARGSLARPMSDAELDAKFRAQAGMLLSGSAAEALQARLRGLASSEDVAATLSPLLIAGGRS